jgi:hypothetical protein
LILDHGGLFEEDAGGGAEEVEEGLVGSGYGGEELPAGEDGGFAGAGADVGLELYGFFAAFEGCACGACPGEAGVDGGEEFFGDGSFGKRKEKGAVELRAGALGFGVELADGLDLVAEEVDADGAVLLGGVDVDDAAANGDLAGHFDDIDAGIADGEEMLDEHVGDVLFADVEMEGEAAVEIAGEEFHAGGFDRDDDEARAGVVRGDLPEGGGASLLDLGVRREIFEGEDVVCRETEDVVRGERARELAGGENGGVEGFCGLVVGHDDDRRSGSGADEVGKIECAGRCSEAGDTSAPCTSAQVAAYTFKGFGVFKVRKELADEG